MKNMMLIFMLLWANSAFAGDAVYTSFFSNNAVSGYDTVAYFKQGKPVKGSKKYTINHLGVKWLFASAENMASFEESPSRYMPQYGGFCAWAVAVNNDRAPGDPNRWKIVNDKLYLNYDSDIQHKWQQDIPSFITSADKNWPALLAN